MEIHENSLLRVFTLFFVLFGLTIPAYGANHYVDKNASGSNNGSSWSNAWTSFSAINWGSIGIPSDDHVRLTLFSIIGEKVEDIVDNNFKSGTHEINFDASGLSSGVYFYRMETGNYVNTKKLIVIK